MTKTHSEVTRDLDLDAESLAIGLGRYHRETLLAALMAYRGVLHDREFNWDKHSPYPLLDELELHRLQVRVERLIRAMETASHT